MPLSLAVDPGAPAHSSLLAERALDAPAIERLLDRAFGPGRFAKVSERVRERLACPLPAQSRVAWRGGSLIGCCRIFEIAVASRPVCFLGPLAVDPAAQSHGLGAALVEACLAACGEARYSAVLLVGAPGFFGRLGFAQVPPGRIVFPGPVEPARVHWRALTEGGLEGLAGPIKAPSALAPAALVPIPASSRA